MIARPVATLPWHSIAISYGDVLHGVGHAPYLIGRDTACDLRIESGSVSRRHALLTFGGDGWEIVDLDSRNGIVLNGRRIRGGAAVGIGDRLMLADVVLSIVQARTGAVARSVEPLPALPSEDTNPVDGFLMFTTHVDHALLSGEILEAERLFAVHLGRPAERAAARGKLDPGAARTLSLLALRLGEATGSAVWLDFVLRLYASSGRVIPLPVVSGMHSLAHRLRKQRRFEGFWLTAANGGSLRGRTCSDPVCVPSPSRGAGSGSRGSASAVRTRVRPAKIPSRAGKPCSNRARSPIRA